MKSIRVSDRTSNIIIRVAGITGGLLLSLMVFLYAFSAYLHWELPLIAFLLISVISIVFNTILGLLLKDYYAGFLIYFSEYFWNYEVMHSETEDKTPAVRIFSACGFYVGIILLLVSFFVPKLWILLASGSLTIQYITVSTITVFVAAKKYKNTSAQQDST